ncbi:MAG: hypothetical protein H7301_09890 [Cryobacterium sp.]|nr:hypothetical protein [Oligoflexia bacterium]
MTLLFDATEAKKFDSRIVERNIQRGSAKQDDYDKFVKDLADDADNAETVSIEALLADNSA